MPTYATLNILIPYNPALETMPLGSTWRTGLPEGHHDERHVKVIEDCINRKTGQSQPIESIERSRMTRLSQSGPGNDYCLYSQLIANNIL